MAKDSLGREWQVATIQLDMNMPDRFDLTCINEQGNRERVVMIHCAIMGSIERFLSIAIEHYAGAFPVWLAPTQVIVLPISDKHTAYARTVTEQLSAHGIRTEINSDDETIGKKIRAAEMMKVPYLLVVGDKESSSNAVAVRKRGGEDLGQMKLEKFIERLKKEIETKT
jgi:threonyl-tRNA synthetase